MTRPISLGIIGAGFMGETYAEVISRSAPACSLAGISGGNRAPDLARKYKTSHVDSVEDLCSMPEVDGVLICSPHAFHAEHAAMALSAGKSVYIEKPMCTTLEDCDRILLLAETNGCVCATAFTQRMRTCNRALIGLLQSGTLGAVQVIHTEQIVPEGVTSVPSWQHQSDNVGILLGHGIHNIDAVRWISGGEIASLAALSRTFSDSVPIEATSSLLLEMDTGAIGYVFCSFETRAPAFPRSQFSARIQCENGNVDLDAYGELRVSLSGEPWKTIATQAPIDWQGQGFLDPVRLESYSEHIRDFCACISEGGTPIASGIDGRNSVEAALAAYASSNSGNRIRLNPKR